MRETSDAVSVPSGYPTSTIFIDESGSRASGSRFFVMGAIKVRSPGRLARAMRAVRDKTRFSSEFKFSEITSGSLPEYYAAVDALAESDAHIVASVVNRDRFDPFPGVEVWEAHAHVAAKLLCGVINRRELVSVILDDLSTPETFSLDEEVRRRVNARFKNTSIVSALCADSKSMDLLQLADLTAGAIAFERRRNAGESRRPGSNPNSPKSKVAARLMAAFALDSLEDVRVGRVNIATLRPPEPGVERPKLRVVGQAD